MQVFRSLEEFEKGTHAVATIGTFDGVHLGHQVILRRVIEAAQAAGGESVVISFHPHPRLVLYPEDNPLRLLQTVEEKIASLEKLGIDKLLLVPFTREFSRLTSDQFIEQVLVQSVGTRRIIIGYDHHFGKNRTGGLSELMAGADFYGFEVEEIPAQQIDNASVSSTKVRKALHAGDMATASKFLGYTYEVTGQVIRGEQLGRKLGYPTANVRPHDKYKLIPSEGVYLAQMRVRDQFYWGMLNIGHKPTVGDFPLGLEINLFDFDADIYDEEVTLYLHAWIREDRRFDSLLELVEAIDGDKAACLALISKMKDE